MVTAATPGHQTAGGIRALVLGAGGHAAIGWEIGLITGLADHGVDLRSAGIVVGTSAGAIVGALMTSEIPLDEIFRRQVDPAAQNEEPSPAADLTRWRSDLVARKARASSDAEFLRDLENLPPAVPDPIDRRHVVARRLMGEAWPARDLRVVAVDVERGARHVFDRRQGVSLIDAVTASGAVAGIWPHVVIDGRRYVDGGFYSIDNADLARGASRVLVLTLPARVPSICVASLSAAVQSLAESGAAVDVVHPDAASEQAFASVGNLLDPSVRAPATLAGREQGRRLAAHVAAFWAGTA